MCECEWRDLWPPARALTTHDEFALLASRATSARVRAALRRNKMRLLDAFRAFDGEQLGRLTYEALYGGLTWLGMDINPAQMLELAGKIDKTGDGFVTWDEFVDAFGPDDYLVGEDAAASSGAASDAGGVGVAGAEQQQAGGAVGGAGGGSVGVGGAEWPPSSSSSGGDPFAIGGDGGGARGWDGSSASLAAAAPAAPASARASGAAAAGAAPMHDPLGALGSGGGGGGSGGGDADGWGGDEDLINFDGPSGAGRVRIESRSLAGKTGGGSGGGPGGSSSVHASPAKGSSSSSSSSSNPVVGPVPPVSSAGATLGIPLSRDVLSGFRLALKQHTTFHKLWTSEATGSRRSASFWIPKIEASVMVRNRDRIPLGSYAVPGYLDPTRVTGQPVNVLEIADNKAWAMTGSAHLSKVIESLFPHPVRFRQVWGQEWRHAAVYAWVGSSTCHSFIRSLNLCHPRVTRSFALECEGLTEMIHARCAYGSKHLAGRGSRQTREAKKAVNCGVGVRAECSLRPGRRAAPRVRCARHGAHRG